MDDEWRECGINGGLSRAGGLAGDSVRLQIYLRNLYFCVVETE